MLSMDLGSWRISKQIIIGENWLRTDKILSEFNFFILKTFESKYNKSWEQLIHKAEGILLIFPILHRALSPELKEVAFTSPAPPSSSDQLHSVFTYLSTNFSNYPLPNRTRDRNSIPTMVKGDLISVPTDTVLFNIYRCFHCAHTCDLNFRSSLQECSHSVPNNAAVKPGIQPLQRWNNVPAKQQKAVLMVV